MENIVVGCRNKAGTTHPITTNIRSTDSCLVEGFLRVSQVSSVCTFIPHNGNERPAAILRTSSTQEEMTSGCGGNVY